MGRGAHSLRWRVIQQRPAALIDTESSRWDMNTGLKRFSTLTAAHCHADSMMKATPCGCMTEESKYGKRGCVGSVNLRPITQHNMSRALARPGDAGACA